MLLLVLLISRSVSAVHNRPLCDVPGTIRSICTNILRARLLLLFHLVNGILFFCRPGYSILGIIVRTEGWFMSHPTCTLPNTHVLREKKYRAFSGPLVEFVVPVDFCRIEPVFML